MNTVKILDSFPEPLNVVDFAMFGLFFKNPFVVFFFFNIDVFSHGNNDIKFLDLSSKDICTSRVM